MRRARRNGDNWETADIPLGEDTEQYVVEVLSGDTVVWQIQCLEPAVLYPSVEETVGFGGPQAVLRLRIAQLSSIAGPGFERSIAIPVL